MADIEIRRAHHLGLKAARAAADKMADHLGKKFSLSGDWDGNTYKFERTGLTGSLAISEKDLLLSVTLGFLLRTMKPSIEMAVRQELDKLFAEKASARPAAEKAEPAKPKKASTRPKKGG